MDMKQILFFALLLVPVYTCKSRCYNETELDDAAGRKLSRHYPQPPLPSRRVTAGSSPSCPVELYRQQVQELISDRSLSPWRHVLKTNMARYPSTYVEAECLCSGCIVFKDNAPVESQNFNSVPIVQSRVFLEKELCENQDNTNRTYRLKPIRVDVAVGCTCVRARTSS
ncbi:interleukin-17C [Thunnus albacares]|uniref:interleukin-17C n=1 Tax=Thunnus albacares TaxID=8236 RepID=UPI001CF668B0|nr:interleukin-17C [Thunnus albacares]